MRREHISYIKDLFIEVSLINMEKYPMHWHDSIEIIFVLKGKLDMVNETSKYEVSKNEIDIINCDEAHSMVAIEDNTEILIIHINPNFFEKFFNNIRDVFLYTNTSYSGSQEDENCYILRKLLSVIAYEIIKKRDNYEHYIKETLVELLYHLVNNFHQLIYIKDNLKENEEQFERYDRILRYIHNNYNNKINLEDIAEKEFLSSNYLSHGIKDNMGYNFHDYINLTRIEESIKLLLNTDKTVSEISEELGFSHIRYFNKHFKKYYKYTPLQYRKKFKVDKDTLEKLKVYKQIDLMQSLEYISCYLEDYKRFNYDSRITKVHIDASFAGESLKNTFNHTINGGRAVQLLGEFEQNYLSKIQKDIGFKFIVINDLFSKDMGIFTDNSGFYNWYSVKKFMDYLLFIDLRPIIVLDNKLNNDTIISLLESFVRYFREAYGDYELGKWEFYVDIELDLVTLENLKNIITKYFNIFKGKIYEFCNDYIYDTCYMLPYIIQNSINNKNLCFKAFDYLDDKTILYNELFVGNCALITQMGLFKPSYYAFFLLSRLGSTVIEKGDGYIVTKEGEDFQILLYSFVKDIDKLLICDNVLQESVKKKTFEKQFSLNLINLYQDYKIFKYEINKKSGSIYNFWINLGKPSRISEEEINLFRTICLPKISFSFAKKCSVFNILTKIQGYGATLFVLKKNTKLS